jgi:GntR family transcriptional regulator, transcriptional repressor for pyruvate dehydrogenase complex
MADIDSTAAAGRRQTVRSLDTLGLKASRHSIVQDVREQLIGLIRLGEVRVNDRLPSEMKLAQLFGVSRPVVREAIVSLNALGLTTSLNGRGTFVTSTVVDAPLLLGGYPPEHVNEIRRCLEIPAARLAALRRTEADVARLRGILLRIDREEEAGRRNKIDAEFHVGIAAVTGNPLLTKLIGDMRRSLEDESLAVSVVANRRAGARAEHLAIVDAIDRQDGAAASDAMCAHLDAIDQSLTLLARPAVASR